MTSMQDIALEQMEARQKGNETESAARDISHGDTPEYKSTKNDAILTSAPILEMQDVLSSTYERFEVHSGNYRWGYRQGDETMELAACGSHPLDETGDRERLELPRYNKTDYAAYVVSCTVQPDTLTVNEYDILDIKKADAAQISSCIYENAFIIDLKPQRGYEITAEWSKAGLSERGFYGQACYVIVTE